MKPPYVDERARERLAQMPAPRRALFLDRDGVINVDTGHPHRADQIEWLPGIFELVRAAWADGYVPIVVTNQAGIAKGYYDEAAFLELTRWIHAAFEQAGAPLLATYYCPHHAEGLVRLLRGKCACRKPEPGLLLQAIADWDIDPGLSMLLGDKDSDIEAARRAGVADARLVAGAQEWRALVPAAKRRRDPRPASTSSAWRWRSRASTPKSSCTTCRTSSITGRTSTCARSSRASATRASRISSRRK
jgi:D-glycero-D-manno-heptose 1,7-bisphosphate phosphatase